MRGWGPRGYMEPGVEEDVTHTFWSEIREESEGERREADKYFITAQYSQCDRI